MQSKIKGKKKHINSRITFIARLFKKKKNRLAIQLNKSILLSFGQLKEISIYI